MTRFQLVFRDDGTDRIETRDNIIRRVGWVEPRQPVTRRR
jgi:hypothetical protein